MSEDAYNQIKTDKKLVIVGDTSDTDDYVAMLKEKAAGNPDIIFTFLQFFFIKSNTSFNFSIKTTDIINGIPSPIEYSSIRTIPFINSCSLAINSNAELKNVPIHGVQLTENNIPNSIAFDKKIYVVIHPDNVSLPFFGKIAELSNGLPIPGNTVAAKNFMNTISKCIDKKHLIAIYPEAHVWDYYTKIREFKEESFRYPAKLDAPVYAITTTYRKRKNKNPRIVAYVDGPFYSDKTKTYAMQKIELRDKVLNAMKERAKTNDIEYIKYVKKGESA